MKILFKFLLIQTVFINIHNNVYSMEPFYQLSDVTCGSLLINDCLHNIACNINNIENSQQYNIYNPNIMHFIQNKYQNNIEIIDGQKYIKLPIQKICKYLNLYDKYNDIKNRVDKFFSNLNDILQEVQILESELKTNKNNSKVNFDYLKKYIKDSLQNIINYQTNLVKVIHSIISRLNNLKELSSKNNIEETLNNYLRITSELLVYDENSNNDLYKNCIDKFCREIDLYYYDNEEHKLKYKSKYNEILLNNFYNAHDNLIKFLNRNLNNISNKINSIENNIIQDMQRNNHFILTVDKYNFRKNYLLDEINSLVYDAKNCYNINFNFIVVIPFYSDINSCNEIVLRELDSYENILTNNAIFRLNHILQKEVIFNCNDEKIIKRAYDKIEEIRKSKCNV